ncbi:hypothetical protein [Paenibacillus odorifer]|uniref:Uncharacterized protein n=1 Tax=Paenibacillus odorifer TaxID=189426 RepID=A0A1R0Y5V0_9BACL|nr:hypothetical protein [Paenibacillus odorifer]OMD42672.1 hypothetical protein BSK52_07680 [Paenibacillus odorifer]
MNNFESKENFDLGLNSVRSTFDQLEVWYREVNSENKILWEVILEIGSEAVWDKLFNALTDKHRDDSAAFIIKKIRELLERDKYSLALFGLNHLLIITNNEEPSEFDKLSITLILDQMLSMDISDLDEMDRLLIDIMRWMKIASNSKLRGSVHEYLHANHAKVNQLIADTNSPDLILAYLYTLLAFDCYSPMRNMMEYLLDKEWPFLDTKLQEEQFAHFLWMSFYLSMDNVLLRVSKQSDYFVEQANLPEIILYKKYYAAKINRKNDDKTLEDIVALMTRGLIFEEPEKTKLWDEIIRFLQTRVNTSISTPELQTNIKKAEDIWQIKNKTDHCPHCSQSKLVKAKFLVDGFKKKSAQVQKQVMFELLTCERCLKVYTYDILNKNLNLALEPYKCKVKLDPIDYPPKKEVVKPIKTIAKKVVTMPTASITSGYFKWPSTEANESQGQSDREGNFREETDLHRLGYRITGLNRNQRWDVLVRKAIPKITLKEIVYTIARNIRLRKSQAGGKTKFAYAIAEWEHDLKRLKQEYYKSNFTWPQY